MVLHLVDFVTVLTKSKGSDTAGLQLRLFRSCPPLLSAQLFPEPFGFGAITFSRMNTEEWKSFAFSLLGLVSGLCLFYFDQKSVKGLC